MEDLVNGLHTALAQKHVAVEPRQDLDPVLILNLLEEDQSVLGVPAILVLKHRQQLVTPKIVQVIIIFLQLIYYTFFQIELFCFLD